MKQILKFKEVSYVILIIETKLSPSVSESEINPLAMS